MAAFGILLPLPAAIVTFMTIFDWMDAPYGDFFIHIDDLRSKGSIGFVVHEMYGHVQILPKIAFLILVHTGLLSFRFFPLMILAITIANLILLMRLTAGFRSTFSGVTTFAVTGIVVWRYVIYIAMIHFHQSFSMPLVDFFILSACALLLHVKRTSFAVGGAFATLIGATLCFTHGLLGWISTIPLLASRKNRYRPALIATWTAIFLSSAWYVKTVNRIDANEFDFMRFATFFLKLLGKAFDFGLPHEAAIATGALVLATSLWCVTDHVRRGRSLDIVSVLVAQGLASAAIIAYGRYALVDVQYRYAGMAQLLIIGLILYALAASGKRMRIVGASLLASHCVWLLIGGINHWHNTSGWMRSVAACQRAYAEIGRECYRGERPERLLSAVELGLLQSTHLSSAVVSHAVPESLASPIRIKHDEGAYDERTLMVWSDTQPELVDSGSHVAVMTASKTPVAYTSITRYSSSLLHPFDTRWRWRTNVTPDDMKEGPLIVWLHSPIDNTLHFFGTVDVESR